MRTPVFAIKARLWRFYGPGTLKLFKNKKGRFELIDLVRCDGKKAKFDVEVI